VEKYVRFEYDGIDFPRKGEIAPSRSRKWRSIPAG